MKLPSDENIFLDSGQVLMQALAAHSFGHCGVAAPSSIWEVSTILHVCWQGPADLLRVWQVEVVHQVYELLSGLRQPWVAALLGSNAAHASALVVMPWEHQGVFWQGEQLAVNVVIQETCIALLEVCPATALDQQGITGEDHASCVRLDRGQVERHAAIGVAWS